MNGRESSNGSHLNAELRLLLACSLTGTDRERQAAIQELLSDGIDWTLFAKKAVAHGLTSSAAYTLARVAPDQLPGDILEAFHAVIDETARRSRALFDELGRLVEALANNGVEAIPLRGPALAIQAYGGLGRRDVGKLEYLVHDADITTALAALRQLDYERDARLDSSHRIEGHVALFGRSSGTLVVLRTRLSSPSMVFDIDYPALWRRAERAELSGKTLLMLAPEDGLHHLALHGGARMWWKLKWSFDLAVFVASYPKLDWILAVECARAQGHLRALLLAMALAGKYLHLPVPAAIVRTESADAIIGPMVRRIVESWQSDNPVISRSGNSLSMDGLRLQDGIVRRVRCVARTVLSSRRRAPPLPRSDDARPASIPIRLIHDVLVYPLSNAYRRMRGGVEHLPYIFAGTAPILALIPAGVEVKLTAKRYHRAHMEARRAVTRTPNDAAAWRGLGDALYGLRRYRKAVACYDKALSFVDHDMITWKRRTAAFWAAGGRADLAESPPDPRDATAWAIHGERLFGLQRFAEATDASDRALSLDPDNLVAHRVGIIARLCVCDWRRRETDESRVASEIRAGHQILGPFWHRAISDSEADSLMLARLCGSVLMRPLTPLYRGERHSHDRIRLAYCSTDFRDHVVAEVMAGCFEHHDRSRFETVAIALGPDDGSATRRRIAAAFDQFLDVQALSDLAVARLMRELEIDIAIDLNGYSGDRRTGIFAHRPAPVQATFQGYAGTMGLPFFDYIIADSVVIPPEHRVYYSEQVVYLPHTYMPYDRNRPIAARTPTRAEAGLPMTGFVFACHHNDYKINPEIFDVWMRLLKQVEGSVLWLRSLNPWAMINLRREANARGVAPDRIVFAPRVPSGADHLARLRLADLFLDTRPYNAHATACDALWVGVPVVTCPGNTFASRVAASVLHAVGLPELVTVSLAEYEALVLALARDPERLARIKTKLTHNRDVEPLFDTARFTRDLEAAYMGMWNRMQEGLPPASFSVDQVPVCTA